jgi:hypothetical protein
MSLQQCDEFCGGTASKEGRRDISQVAGTLQKNVATVSVTVVPVAERAARNGVGDERRSSDTGCQWSGDSFQQDEPKLDGVSSD